MTATMINKPKEIASLLQKFMAGVSSIDEEKRLAVYFRSADVPADWMAYKMMFAYFDAGMPADLDSFVASPVVRRKRRVVALWVALTAVAAAVIALIVITTRNETPLNSASPVVSVVKDTAHAVRSDTATMKPIQQKQVIRTLHYRRFEPSKSKSYMAEVQQKDTAINVEDEFENIKMHQLIVEQTVNRDMLNLYNAFIRSQNIASLGEEIEEDESNNIVIRY